MHKNIIFIFIFILFSCNGTRSISYKKARQLNLNKDYQAILNEDIKIDLKKYYFEIYNISKITADRKSKTINIFQTNKKSESFYLTEIETETFKSRYETQNKDSISLIVNGILIDKNDRKNYQIEYNAVKSVIVLKDADATILNCSGNGGKNILIILTE